MNAAADPFLGTFDRQICCCYCCCLSSLLLVLSQLLPPLSVSAERSQIVPHKFPPTPHRSHTEPREMRDTQERPKRGSRAGDKRTRARVHPQADEAPLQNTNYRKVSKNLTVSIFGMNNSGTTPRAPFPLPGNVQPPNAKKDSRTTTRTSPTKSSLSLTQTVSERETRPPGRISRPGCSCSIGWHSENRSCARQHPASQKKRGLKLGYCRSMAGRRYFWLLFRCSYK